MRAWRHRTRGRSNQPTSTARDDGLRLHDAWMGSAVRCAPPANRPTPGERDRCAVHLRAELAALPQLRVVLALGAFAWEAAARVFNARPRPRFGHRAQCRLDGRLMLVGCYHPSRQNTSTGVLTREMLDRAVTDARDLSRG